MTSALVTGSSGFVGTHLCEMLRTAGCEVHAATSRSGDVADPATWAAFPVAETVVHLAARSFVPESWQAPAAFYQTNVMGTVHALEYCRMRGARLVYVSSYLYRSDAAPKVSETAPLKAYNPYALSKLLAEELCRFYGERHGVHVVVLRPFNVYGPGQDPRFLIAQLIQQARAGGPLRVKTLAPRRDYVHVRDIADAIRRCVLGCSEAGAYNLGTGVSHSVADVIEIIQSLASTPLQVVVDNETREGEIMDTVADAEAARRILGWMPSYSLRQGLAELLSVP